MVDYDRLRVALRAPAILALLMLMPFGAANAVVVIEQALLTTAPDGAESTLDTSQPTPAGVESADRFFLPQTAEILNIGWFGSYDGSPPSSDNFTVRIFGDNGGLPADTPLVELTGVDGSRTTTSTTDAFGAPVFSYNLSPGLTPILTGGNTYYLSVVNLLDLTSDSSWFWAQAINTDSVNYERVVPDPFGVGPNPTPGPWDIGLGEFSLASRIEIEPIDAQVSAPSPFLLMAPFVLLALRRVVQG